MILNAHSCYSLRYGTLSTEDMVAEAIDKDYDTIALTDINNTTAALKFVKLCAGKIKPIVGAEFRNGDDLLFVALAMNNEGFRQINEALTQKNVSGRSYTSPENIFDHCFLVYPHQKSQDRQLKDNEYTGVRLTDLKKILTEKKEVQKKYVILQDTCYKDRNGYELHKKLRAIDRNLLLSQLQAGQMAGQGDYLIPRQKLLAYFEPFPHIIENTKRLVENCSFEFDFKEHKNKKTFTGSAYEDKQLLRKLALIGLNERYGENNKVALARVEKELAIIDQLGFSSYFLITWDMVAFSLHNNYYHYGRGSGANSVVAYCLKITDVCPIELDLYFERFLNPKRHSPPDFDIDYSWKDRDKIYNYMFGKYGAGNKAALLGAMVTFQDSSIIREMGKVHGLPKDDIDRLIKYPESPLNKTEICREILKHYAAIENFPSIRSIHAGGILISEAPLTYYTALDLPPKGYVTTQFDMHIAEAIGFEKLDILSQRGLGHIKEAGELILKNKKVHIDTHDVEKFKTDPLTNELLEAGNTIGCFYIESPAMRGLLRKLKCRDYLTLVAASSIIRPGVAKSGMMKAYIERTRFPGNFKYLHPIMEQQLKETHGVMVYQEDVLKVAHYFGGLDLADADVLRRMMSGKGKNSARFEQIEKKYYDYCGAQNYDPGVAREVWRQIESFAGYSFAKGHSASYATESYQSLYLKTHFPLEFIVAVINNFGGFYSTKVYVNEARRLGGQICLPCVNKSEYTTTLYRNEIYLGFVHIKSLQQELAMKIGQERERYGIYLSLENFKLRTRVSLDQLIILIRLDALRFTGRGKRELLWEAQMLYNQRDLKRKDLPESLFKEPVVNWTLPKLVNNKIEDAYDELELLEFPVSLTEFDLLKTKFRGDCTAGELMKQVGKTIKMVGNYIAHKSLRTAGGDPMAFGTFTDVNGDFFDTVNFPPCLRAYPFKGWGAYLIRGRVTEDFGVPAIEVEKMARLEIVLDERHL